MIHRHVQYVYIWIQLQKNNERWTIRRSPCEMFTHVILFNHSGLELYTVNFTEWRQTLTILWIFEFGHSWGSHLGFFPKQFTRWFWIFSSFTPTMSRSMYAQYSSVRGYCILVQTKMIELDWNWSSRFMQYGVWIYAWG